MVFQSIQVLVPLSTMFAAIRLFFLHAEGTRIRCGSLGIDDGERTVAIVVQCLVDVTMLPAC